MTDDTHTIGEVLNELRGEFEDITISKIRFLEAEGLISPDRTESGYRQFTVADIDRLRYVLRAQRDRYLPLKVIKDELERLDAGLPVDRPPVTPDEETAELVRGHADDTSTAGVGGHGTDTELDEAGLAEAADVAPAVVGELRDHGLIGDEGPYDQRDLAAVRGAGRLLELGLEPRHLRMFRQFTDRQQGLGAQMVSPLLRQRNPEAREQAQTHLETLVRESLRIQRALLDRATEELLRS